MTARPALETLDAAPEPARWCCTGNAEDCALCDTAALPYPWICPGHPDTGENRQRVQAAAEAVRCCVCGGGQVVYRNFRDLPFCGLCADCPCGQTPCVRTGVGDPEVSETAEVQRLRRMIRQIMTGNRAAVGKLTDAHQATIGELRRAEAQVRDLEQQLAALRAVSRGYCPACGRGDAAPTVDDWEQQKQRADQAEAKLRRYQSWLADQLAKAETRDQVTGEVPPELRISPHSGIASGIRTALYGLDRILDQQPATLEERP